MYRPSDAFKAELAGKYEDLSTKYRFKYKSFNDAVVALQNAVGTQLAFPDRIDFYVPGKVPREDGDPYFIFDSVIDITKNDCLTGYMNLVTGETKSWSDSCRIYD